MRPTVRRAVLPATLFSACVLFSVLLSGSAAAGNASVVTGRGNELRYVAVAGEENGVVITVTGSTYQVIDTAGITAATGCTQIDAFTARCTATIFRINVTLGDGNDFLQSEPATSTSADGGSGNDTLISGAGTGTLTGGDGDDSLNGRLGADSMSGGSGTDTVRYANHTAAVVVTLDDVANDGVVGESDNVRSDVENVFGGSGGDLITGDADANDLNGASGNDTLNGMAGADELVGAIGNDTLNGGDQPDLLDGGAGADKANGGSHAVNPPCFVLICGFVGDTVDYSARPGNVAVLSRQHCDVPVWLSPRCRPEPADDVSKGIDGMGAAIGLVRSRAAVNNRVDPRRSTCRSDRPHELVRTRHPVQGVVTRSPLSSFASASPVIKSPPLPPNTSRHRCGRCPISDHAVVRHSSSVTTTAAGGWRSARCRCRPPLIESAPSRPFSQSSPSPPVRFPSPRG